MMAHHPIPVRLCQELVLLLIVILATLIKGELIQYLEEPMSTVVLQNSPVVLTCPVTPASAQVQWYYQDKPINNGYQGVMVNGTSLSISEFHSGNTLYSHEGMYYCIATTDVGSLISQPAWLQVPQFDGFSSEEGEKNITVRVIEGGTVSLPCGSLYSRPKAHLAFEKVNDTGNSNSSYPISTPSNNLLLSNVQVVDAGIYKCVATNPLTNETSTSSQTVTLNVKSLESTQNQPPFIFGSKKPTILNVPEGDTIVLECAAYAKPLPKITWRKYGGQLSHDRREAKLSGNYIIKDVNHRDKGTYICHADNGIGNKVEKVFQIEVFEPPKIDTGHVVVEEGSKAILSCIINKKSNFSIKWYHNGQQIAKSRNIRIRDTSIVIKSVDLSSSGLYQCMVYNILGALYAVIQLEVKPIENKKDKNNTRIPIKDKWIPYGSQQTPNVNILENNHRIQQNKGKVKNRKKNSDMVVPTKPKVTKQSDTSVLVEWTIPNNYGLAIKFFVVQYKQILPKKVHWHTEDEQILSKFRKVTVYNLKPGSTYKFRIVAVYSNNDNAQGANSDPFTLVSDGDHSSVKRLLIVGPTIVKVEELVVDKIYAIVVEWKYTPLKSIPISGFIIFYKRYQLDVSFTNITLNKPKLRMHIIKNLEPDTDYKIKMECFNKHGYSKFSNKVVKRTSAVEDSHYPPITQITTLQNNNHHDHNSFQSSGELLYKILGGILSVMVLVLLVLIVMCCIRQRQPPFPRASYYKESLSRMNGSLSNGSHHSHHNQYCQHSPIQPMPKSYTVTDLIDGYTSAPISSKPMYPGHVGNHVHEDMYNHSVGDSNCNNIDQSKSPQIMQVKHTGSNNNQRHANCTKLEKLKSGGSLNGLEHILPCNKPGHLMSSSNSVNHSCGSYEKITTRSSNNSLFHPQENSMVPNTNEHSQPSDNFLIMNTHNSKPKKKRQRQYTYEHSTRDQATNTDLSSNEGTLEFSPLKKSPSIPNKELISSAYSLSNSKPSMQALNTDTPILEENAC